MDKNDELINKIWSIIKPYQTDFEKEHFTNLASCVKWIVQRQYATIEALRIKYESLEQLKQEIKELVNNA